MWRIIILRIGKFCLEENVIDNVKLGRRLKDVVNGIRKNLHKFSLIGNKFIN